LKQRLNKSSEIETYLQKEKAQQKAKKELYRNTLNYQLELKKNHPMLGTMTAHEKRMNKADLHEFKHEGNKIHHMIPGVSNIDSVGSLPTKRVGLNDKSSPLKSERASIEVKKTGLSE